MVTAVLVSLTFLPFENGSERNTNTEGLVSKTCLKIDASLQLIFFHKVKVEPNIPIKFPKSLW